MLSISRYGPPGVVGRNSEKLRRAPTLRTPESGQIRNWTRIHRMDFLAGMLTRPGESEAEAEAKVTYVA